MALATRKRKKAVRARRKTTVAGPFRQLQTCKRLSL